MNAFFKKISVLLLLASIAALSGCAAIQGNSTGGDSELVGDLLTERAVIRALYDEQNLNGARILVGCVDGIVTLTGSVDTDVERQLAERVTRGIKGVTKGVRQFA